MSTKLLMEAWSAYWFPPSSGLQLAICRIVVVGAKLIFFFPSLDSHLALLQPFRGYVDPQVLMRALGTILPGDKFPSADAFVALYWVTALAGIMALVGLFTRISSFVFALGNWIFIAHMYSYGDEHHPDAIMCIFLMLLAFSPSGARLSLDSFFRRLRKQRAPAAAPACWFTAMWPVRMVQLLLCFAYVSTGLAKLLFGGVQWMNGYTLQQHVFDSAVARDLPLGMWLAQQHALCLWLSIGVIAFEVLFFVALIVPRTLPFFLLGGALLHVGIYFTEGSSFFQFIVLYIAFYNVEGWRERQKDEIFDRPLLAARA